MNKTTAFILPLALAAVFGRPAMAVEADVTCPTLNYAPPGPAWSPCSPTNPLFVNTQPAAMVTANVAVGNSLASVNLPGVSGKTTYICGFAITGDGASGAVVVMATVASVVSGNMNFAYADPAGATAGATPIVENFYPCLPATAPNTPIVVSLPAMGSGNTLTIVNAYGYQQ